MIISFSFLSLLDDNYKKAILEFNTFDKDNWLHFDVMDGKFVENKTFNHKLIKEINSYNNLFSDVHLMIDNPSRVIKKYIKSGANQITFHYESQDKEKTLKIIKKIKKYDIKAGISIKPNTKIESIDYLLPYVDYILIMSVEPGKGGQKFIENSIEKVKYLKQKRENKNYLIGIDGGINSSNAKTIKEAGADVIIVGTYLANNLNPKTIQLLK